MTESVANHLAITPFGRAALLMNRAYASLVSALRVSIAIAGVPSMVMPNTNMRMHSAPPLRTLPCRAATLRVFAYLRWLILRGLRFAAATRCNATRS